MYSHDKPEHQGQHSNTNTEETYLHISKYNFQEQLIESRSGWDHSGVMISQCIESARNIGTIRGRVLKTFARLVT